MRGESRSGDWREASLKVKRREASLEVEPWRCRLENGALEEWSYGRVDWREAR